MLFLLTEYKDVTFLTVQTDGHTVKQKHLDCIPYILSFYNIKRLQQDKI